ncbi:MAG: YfiT family bacillithiol transferase [Janthinobacterium lividum]
MSSIFSAPPSSSDPRYPVGHWRRPEHVDTNLLAEALDTLGELPQNLREAVKHLDGEQLDTPYREGGWTVRQLVHHIADSHMNCYLRVRFALTEDAPTIMPYSEKAWAALHDCEAAPVEWSLELVESMHARLLMLLRSLSPAQWQRTYVHPENGVMPLWQVASLYAWHSRHHVAHITALRAARDW